MSKLLVFTCSPHKRGTTAALLAEVIKGAKDKGAEVVEYDMNAPDIHGCQACNACGKQDADCSCVQKDYLAPMYADLREADGILVGSPIYMGNLTAQAWLLLNRLRPTSGPDFTPRVPGKRFATVITQGNPDGEMYKPIVESLKAQMERRGWESVGSIIWAGAGGEPSDELKQECYEAGQQLV